MQRNTSIKIRQQQPTQWQSSSAHAMMTWVEKQPRWLSLSRDVCSLCYDTHHYRSFRWLTPLLLTAPRAFHPLVDLMIWPRCSPNMNRSQKGMPRNSYPFDSTHTYTHFYSMMLITTIDLQGTQVQVQVLYSMLFLWLTYLAKEMWNQRNQRIKWNTVYIACWASLC